MRKWFALMLLVSAIASAENGVSDDRVVIGQTAGLTGQVAGSVREMNEGAHAYLAWINRRGGVHGRKIELRTLDDRFDPALAAANTETLVKKERVFAMFLSRGTPHTEAILPLLAANGVPLVAPSTGADTFRKPINPLLFNVRARYRSEVAKAVEYFSTVGIAKIGLAHVDDTFGRDVLAGFRDAMQAHGLTPAVIVGFNREAPEILPKVASITQASPGALIVAGSAATTASLVKAIRLSGNRMQIMTLSNNSSQSFIADLGAAGVGVIVSQVTPAPDLMSSGLGQEFVHAARETGATASYAAMEGFVAAKVLVEGLRRAGRQLTREGFLQALESMHKTDLGGLAVSYSETDHAGSEFVELTMIGRNGRFVR
jgi:ABC-type branched-subunit amino acid transport system substrate-binding protein